VKLVGQRIQRIDGLSKVLGKTKYADDYLADDFMHAGVLRSHYPHAQLISINTEEAKSVPGVICVLTAQDIPGRNSFGVLVKDQPILAFDKVRYMGDAIAVVAGETKAIVDEALKKIHVEYKELPCITNPIEALEEGAPEIHAGGNLLVHHKVRKGDIEKGFREADVIHEEKYKTSRKAHCPLETEAGFSKISDDGLLTVWASTQTPHYDREEIAACLDIPQSRVRVIQTVTGGGFGSKIDISVQCILALVTWKTKRPAKMTYSLKEHFTVTHKRHPAILEYKVGAKKDGKITAAKISAYYDTGAYASYGPSGGGRASHHAMSVYEVPNLWSDIYVVYTNNTTSGAMRGFAIPQVTFACESHMEALARKLGINPVQFRLKNVLRYGSQTATGQILSTSVGIEKTIISASKAAHWSYE